MSRASSRSDAVRGLPSQGLVRPQGVRVLEEDPELAASLSGPDHRAALSVAIAPMAELPRGPWTFLPPVDPAALGALILDGLVTVN